MLKPVPDPKSPADGRRREARRELVYRFIVYYKRAHDGNSPTIREIQAGVGLRTSSGVHLHLRHLVHAGLITMGHFETRSICVVGAEWRPPDPTAVLPGTDHTNAPSGD